MPKFNEWMLWKRLLSEAIYNIGDIYRWKKFIFGVAVAQRYNAFITLSEIQKSSLSDFTHHYSWIYSPGKTHYNFFQLKYQFISSIWHDYLTRISQISQNHTSLSLVCSRPDGKREWNDAFSRDLRDSRETKSCVKREYFYNAFSLILWLHCTLPSRG